jgi:hypothetical protein
MAFAALLYIYRVTDTTSVATVTPEYIEDGRPTAGRTCSRTNMSLRTSFTGRFCSA